MAPAALALSIDCDGCTVERLRRVFRYWATADATEFGRGLELPVAASMFAYARNPSAPPQASYLDGDREGLLEAYRRGWIDSLHGLGDFSLDHPCTREMARRAFDALAADGVRLKVWTNHGGQENIQNLLRPTSGGDVPGSSLYLADLAWEYGIRYVWAGDLTPVVGQGRPATPGEYYRGHLHRSGWSRWVARAAHGWGERLVRRMGIEPYRGNALVERRLMRDGRAVAVFRRYGRWRFDTISRLPDILSPAVLDRLSSSGGSMVVYLHIGPSADETPESLIRGLRALDEVARRRTAGSLEVVRTGDLLERVAPQQ